MSGPKTAKVIYYQCSPNATVLFQQASYRRMSVSLNSGHAQLLAQTIGTHPELELLAPVPLSAVCFRHREKDNEAILKRIIARGCVYLSNATINGQFALRACFVNHRTKEDDVRAIVTETIAAAKEVNR